MDPNQFVRIFLQILTLSLSVSADTLLNVAFDNHPEGQYTLEMARKDFPGADWYAGMKEGRGSIASGAGIRGKALRVMYPKGCVGANQCAVQIKAILSEAVDTAVVSYRVMFDNEFQFVRGGKLPGLCGKDCITGGGVSDGTNGWSARLMWRNGGDVVQYVYYPDMNDPNHPGYGEDMSWNYSPPQKRFIPGTWHMVKTQIIMNKPGEKNGIIRSWFDGELSLERTDISFRTVSEVKIDKFYISTFHGGSDSSWAPQEDVFIYFDDFMVVTDIIENVTHSRNRHRSVFYRKQTTQNFKTFSIHGKLLDKSSSANITSVGVFILKNKVDGKVCKKITVR